MPLIRKGCRNVMVSRRERVVMAKAAPQIALDQPGCYASGRPCALLTQLASVFSGLPAPVRIIPALHCKRSIQSPFQASEDRAGSIVAALPTGRNSCHHDSGRRTFSDNTVGARPVA